MRPQKVDDQQLMAGLMAVLRAKGYDGASLNDLAEATGLKKASLYHRFPGGKKEIVEAVLNYVLDWIKQNISGILLSTDGKPQERLSKTLNNVRALYNDGDSICILRALTNDTGLPLFGLQIEESFQVWLEGFTQLGLDLGFNKSQSERMAREVLIKVQGSLILSKAMDDLTPFQQSLSDIEQIYKH